MASRQNNNTLGIALLVASVGLIVVLFAARQLYRPAANPALAALAQCLTAKGVVMYGADWCPHCQDQKAMFGSAFASVNYVHCDKDPDTCLKAGVNGYPTWVFSSSSRSEGTQSLANLARSAGCPWTQ